MSHDAATGYHTSRTSSHGEWLVSSYTQTQQHGTVYDQLQAGARALDLRPKLLRNGTIIFHHGVIPIPVSFHTMLPQVLQWGRENPTELVLLLTSHYDYQEHEQYENEFPNDDHIRGGDTETFLRQFTNNTTNNNSRQTRTRGRGTSTGMVAALTTIYQQYGIPYHSCAQASTWTMGDLLGTHDCSRHHHKATCGIAAVANGVGGHLLALDGNDDNPGAFCGKANYVESRLVTCYDPIKQKGSRTNQSVANSSIREFVHRQSPDPFGHAYRQCTDPPRFPESAEALRKYLSESVHNAPTNDESILGPPGDSTVKIFNELQALWQVNRHAVQVGLFHGSTLLRDNAHSQLHAQLVSWIYYQVLTLPHAPVRGVLMNGNHDSGGGVLVAMDNVALHGNAVLSVLRNMCGQADPNDAIFQGRYQCGSALPPPPIIGERP